MASRYSGGIAGWIAGALPLVAVNIADYLGVFAFQDAMLAGAVALVGGALICGVVAGSLAGRARPGRLGGAASAAPSGILAALLYVITVAVLVVGTGVRDAAFTFDLRQWLGLGAGLLFFAALPLGVALATGGIVGRQTRQRSALPSMPTRQGPMPAPRTGPRPPVETWGDVRERAPRQDWQHSPGWNAETSFPRGDEWQPPANRPAPRSNPTHQYAPPGREGRRPGDAPQR
jgi:hypothetical protein